MPTINNISIDVSEEVLSRIEELEEKMAKMVCRPVTKQKSEPFIVVDGIHYISEAEISKYMIVSYEGGTHIDTKVHLKPKKQELCVLHSGEGSWVTYTDGSFEFKKGVKS